MSVSSHHASSVPPDDLLSEGPVIDATAVTDELIEIPHEHPRRLPELLAWSVIILLADFAIYRGGGFSGWAVLFVGLPLFLGIGARQRRLGLMTWAMTLMLFVAGARLFWLGSPLLIGCGCLLLAAFGMSLAGRTPHLIELAGFIGQLIPAGFRWFHQQGLSITRHRPTISQIALLNVIIPAIALAAFGTLFVLANPDLLTWLGHGATEWIEQLRHFLFNNGPQPLELLFCGAIAWLAAGLLWPLLPPAAVTRHVVSKAERTQVNAPLYPAFRNTLLAVSALFAVYLVFEFQTLWFRKFPPGFHYSGYAHQGAAWLTVALALATLVLSAVFRADIMRDPRLPQLQRLAWIWSLENFILVAAVYHRLFIYVGFNGMTRMRVVGLFGVTTVAVGFAIVLWRIAQERDFIWLIRRQLWALALAVYLYCLTPVDALTSWYNVNRILSGDPAPCVQLSVHPLNAEGITWLLPLTECSNDAIREGIKALLAEHDAKLEATQQAHRHWSHFQAAEKLARDRLAQERGRWAEYIPVPIRAKEQQAFHDYAYQWY